MLVDVLLLEEVLVELPLLAVEEEESWFCWWSVVVLLLLLGASALLVEFWPRAYDPVPATLESIRIRISERDATIFVVILLSKFLSLGR